MKTELSDKILTAYREAKADPDNPENRNQFDFPWSETVYGSDGRSLYVHERSDRPGAVRVRWGLTDDEQAERGEASRVAPSVTTTQALRNERGALLKRACARAVDAAKEEYERWLNPPEVQGEGPTRMSLLEGFMYAADPTTGIAIETDQWRTFLFARPEDDTRVTVSVYQIVDRVIGLRETTWAEWTLEHARIIWRTLASESKDGRGYRLAEQTVGAVYSIADHLRSVGKIRDSECVAPRGWRRMLKREWQAETKTEIQVARPRYSEAETAALVRGFREAQDARLRTAGVFGIGFRRGHVVRTKRSGLHLDDTGTYGQGRVVIPGGTGKKGGTVDLTASMRAYFEWLLTGGYLSELEAAREEGRIDDYYLIPGNRFIAGKAQVRFHGTHLTKRELSRRFNALEDAVEVRHIDGRSWHALRRSMSDEIASETTDEMARDIAQGWTPGGGARDLYMDKDRREKEMEATEARNAALRRLAGASGAADALTAEIEGVRRGMETLKRLMTQHESFDTAPALGAAKTLIEELEELAKQASEKATEAELSHRSGLQEHEPLAARVRAEMDRRGLTGKRTAEIVGAPESQISAIRRGKSAGVVSAERLSEILERLMAEPEMDA